MAASIEKGPNCYKTIEPNEQVCSLGSLFCGILYCMSEKIEVRCEPEFSSVCRLIGGGQPETGQLKEIYVSELNNLRKLVKPCALAGFFIADEELSAVCGFENGTSYLAVLLSLGDAGSRYVEALFSEGEHLRGIVADALQSAWLFAADEKLEEHILKLCRERGFGVSGRLEAPRDLPIVMQKLICDRLGAKEQMGVHVNDSGMLVPEKSMCYLLALCEDSGSFAAGHDCARCEKKNCGMRKETHEMVEIVVEDQGKKCTCEAGAVLMDTLRANGIRLAAPCGGTGRCGKCRVRVLKGELPATAADRSLLSERELESGVRLACTARPTENLRIRLLQKPERRIAAVADISPADGTTGLAARSEGLAAGTDDLSEQAAFARKTAASNQDAAGYGIAVDIGTTTLAACLYGWSNGQIYETVTAVNSGRDFGADVLTRMEASNNGKRARLQELMQEDIQELLTELLTKTGADAKTVQKIVLAANMTMVHLLMGYSCEKLGKAPFTPANKKYIRADALRLLGDTRFSCPVEILPAVSAFVGGDIVAGMLAWDMDAAGETELCTEMGAGGEMVLLPDSGTDGETVLLLDVGTNGEMALHHQGSIWVASAAAGPAFEGGGIRCGCASVPGAISSVHISDTDFKPSFTTIGGEAAVGICGSGVLELVSELLRVGLVDETGLLAEAYREDGFLLGRTPEGERIVFTQADIRQVQLAKGAIRAGIETLLARACVRAGDVKHIYVAGGFGVRMDVTAAIRIGLLPQAFAGHIKAVGNSSLAGAKLSGRETNICERLDALLARCREVVLAGEPEFEACYVEQMGFSFGELL